MARSEPLAGNLNRDLQAEMLAFLDTLDHRRHQAALYPFDSAERFDWHYVPRQRPGLHLADMDGAQRRAALRLLATALSDTGFASAQGIMALEDILKEREHSAEYDPGAFAFAVFGNPHAGAPWSWRVDGHHLSITFTVIDDQTIVALPHFMGANPAVIGGIHTVLGAEEELGRALMLEMDDATRACALRPGQPPADILTGPGREHALHRPEGLAWARMDEDGRRRLLELIEVYAHRLHPGMAALELERVDKAGPENLRFLWAGGFNPGEPHYYRIHGPTLIIEYDNTQAGANHIHTVWHDPALDFGRDFLGEHYGRAH